MNYLSKAKKAVKDAQDLNDSLKKLGIKTPIGNKSSESAGPPSVAPTTSSAAPSVPPVATPASSTANASTANVAVPDGLGPSVPICAAEGVPTKMPLAARKSLRDGFEVNKGELEAKLSKTLGVPWTIFVDGPGVYSYSVHQSAPKTNIGYVINRYFDGANRRIDEFVAKYGADGKNELNRLAHKHIITLEPTAEESVRYGAPRIDDGRLIILFRDTQLSVNDLDALENIGQIVNAASKSSGGSDELSMDARKSIQDNYDTQIGEQLKLAQQYLKAPIEFRPNFEINYAELLAYEKSLDLTDQEERRKIDVEWARKIGQATLSYFEGFVARLKDNKFHEDDMLQEGFNEAVDKHIISLVVTDKITKSYNDIVIAGGSLLIRTTPAQWWVNSKDATNDLLELL